MPRNQNIYKELSHPHVIGAIREASLADQRIRVTVGKRSGYFLPQPSQEWGWWVRVNGDRQPWVIRGALVRYSAKHEPLYFLFRADRGNFHIPDDPPSMRRLKPRNPDWDATMREPEKKARKIRKNVVMMGRKYLLAASQVIETINTMREALEWLRAIEQQARIANSPAADSVANVCAKLEKLLEPIPK